MRSRRKPTAFRPAFDSAQEVHDLVDQGLAERVTREQAFEAGLKLHRGVGDIRAHLRCIYRWKLGAFIRRFEWVRIFPEGVSDELLRDAVARARAAVAKSDDKKALCAALNAFNAIDHVGIQVASAFLMAMDKEHFTIIDRQACKALSTPFRDGASAYVEYLWFCRAEAKRLGVTLEDHDRALQQRGVEVGRQSKQHSRQCRHELRHVANEI